MELIAIRWVFLYFLVYCGVILCMLRRPCITEIFLCVSLFFLLYGNSAWVRFKNWLLKGRGYVMIKGRQNDSVSLALELRHSGSGYCFFAWLMFLPGSLHQCQCVKPRMLWVGCLQLDACIRKDALPVLVSNCSIKVGCVWWWRCVVLQLRKSESEGSMLLYSI